MLLHLPVRRLRVAANGVGQTHCSWADGFAYAAWQGQSDKAQAWSSCSSFDSMGRAIAGATVIDGVSYGSTVIYDLLGRAQRSQDPSGKWLIAGGQNDHRIAVLKIDAATGKLTATGQSAEVGAPVCVIFAK